MVELVIKFRGAINSISGEFYTYEVPLVPCLLPLPPKKAPFVFLFMHYLWFKFENLNLILRIAFPLTFPMAKSGQKLLEVAN